MFRLSMGRAISTYGKVLLVFLLLILVLERGALHRNEKCRLPKIIGQTAFLKEINREQEQQREQEKVDQAEHRHIVPAPRARRCGVAAI